MVGTSISESINNEIKPYGRKIRNLQESKHEIAKIRIFDHFAIEKMIESSKNHRWINAKAPFLLPWSQYHTKAHKLFNN